MWLNPDVVFLPTTRCRKLLINAHSEVCKLNAIILRQPMWFLVFFFLVWGFFGWALCCYTNNSGEIKPSQFVTISCVETCMSVQNYIYITVFCEIKPSEVVAIICWGSVWVCILHSIVHLKKYQRNHFLKYGCSLQIRVRGWLIIIFLLLKVSIIYKVGSIANIWRTCLLSCVLQCL